MGSKRTLAIVVVAAGAIGLWSATRSGDPSTAAAPPEAAGAHPSPPERATAPAPRDPPRRPPPSSRRPTHPAAPTGAWPPSGGSAGWTGPSAEASGEAQRQRADLDDEPLADDDPPLRTIWPVDREGIQGAVKEAIPELKHCYEEWLKQDPALEGKLVLDFSIDVPEDGRTAEDGTELAAITTIAVRDSTMEHPWMEACAMSVFGDLHFDPPAGGGVEVSYPVIFASIEED